MNTAPQSRIVWTWTWPVVVLLFCLAGPAMADNKAVVEAMSAVIKEHERMSDWSDARKQALCDIIAEVLLKAPDLERDKADHAAEHIRVLLKRGFLSSTTNSELNFKVVEMRLRRALDHYVRLPAILAIERETLVLRLATCKEVVAEFIEETYTDTPADVREKLIARVHEHLDGEADTLGNYFFPFQLYPAKKEPSLKTMRAELAKHPFTKPKDNATKFAPTAKKLAEPDVSPNQVESKWNMDIFLSIESSRLEMSCRQMDAFCYDQSQLGRAYRTVPKALQDAEIALQKEESEQFELVRRARRQNMNNDQEPPASQPASRPAAVPAR